MKELSDEDYTSETNLHTIALSKLYRSIQSVLHLHVSAVSSDTLATIHNDEFWHSTQQAVFMLLQIFVCII